MCWEAFLDSPSRACHRLGRTGRVDHQSLPRSRSSRVVAKGLRSVFMTLVRGATQGVSTPPTPPESQRSPSITSMAKELDWACLVDIVQRHVEEWLVDGSARSTSRPRRWRARTRIASSDVAPVFPTSSSVDAIWLADASCQCCAAMDKAA